MKREELIRPLEGEMIEKLARLVKHNSERGEAGPGMPFGPGPAACLKEALQIFEEEGFKTTNVDNYCGYAEMGEGTDIIGIVSHLDIVPAGEGWDTDPFTVTRKDDGRIYGRGVSDDKGSVIASLYAMKIVRDMGVPMKKRVRMLMGCNEESGSECMAYYNAHCEPITTGFTPDGDFPGIHGEKGMVALNAYSKNTRIISMNGGIVKNAVCTRCTTVIPRGDLCPECLRKALSETALTSFEVTADDDTITIEAVGKSAHAAGPLKGINAAGCTMQALEAAGFEDDFVKFYNSHIGITCDGAGLGIKCEDEYGVLTLNNGIVRTEDGVISCTLDIRRPVTITEEQIREWIAPYLEDENGRIEIEAIGPTLFYPLDSPLVSRLYQAYVDATGDTEHKPMVIGGGTYAKSIPGIIAFGCQFQDGNNHIHDANESLVVEEFLLQVDIYVQAILNLLED
ncbi:MAG: Sapep family Mn(2+)-dependent dipeptidase [Lachnospiraceae bacterium]|nr:Sapep family Mn(2+)-dependent dipeptidase [Lachnospiraceae bacterium]